MRLWGFTMREEVSSLSGHPWPPEFRKLLPFHAQRRRRWILHVFLSRESPHNLGAQTTRFAPNIDVRNVCAQAGEPQGTEQLSLPTCSSAEETLMCFLLQGKSQWVLVYRLTAMSFVSSQDWFLLLKRLWKSCWLFLCYTASTAQVAQVKLQQLLHLGSSFSFCPAPIAWGVLRGSFTQPAVQVDAFIKGVLVVQKKIRREWRGEDGSSNLPLAGRPAPL